MNAQTSLLIERVKPVVGCAPAALATTAGDGDWVSMKHYRHLTIVISILNGTTVTGTAVTLLQAQDVAATASKALGFTKMWANTDTAAAGGDTLTETAVVSNTFTTSTTNAKSLLYVIEIQDTDLDVDGGFDCVRFDGANAANSVGCVMYILSDPRYPGEMPSAIVD